MNAPLASARQNGMLSELGAFDPGGDWGGAARAYLERARCWLRARHQQGASGSEIVAAQTAVVDHVVSTLFQAAYAAYAARFSTLDEKVCVAALGGYGRGELNPCSDIDLVFLHGSRRGRLVETVTERVVQTLWDTGMTVGHALHNARSCTRLAARDLTVRTAVLDARYIAGDPEPYAELMAAVDRELIRRGAGRFVAEKLKESEQRHRRWGDSIFLVEPNVKEGKGGLRDLHTALWLARVRYKTNDLAELVRKGILTERELANIRAARDFVWRVRNSLHFLTGQHHDQLTLDDQARVAADLGFTGRARVSAAEMLLREFYGHAEVIQRFAEEIIARCTEEALPYRFIGTLTARTIRPGVRIVRGELVVGDAGAFRNDPALLVRVFADAQRHEVRLSDGTRRLIRRDAHQLRRPEVRNAPEVAAAFREVLSWKRGVYAALREMHELGVLGALLPEFARLRCMPQYDRYHRYTVDEHSLRGVLALERLRSGQIEQSEARLTALMRQVDRVDLLYLAMLLHDIGKGRGGRHSERGAQMVRRVARRLHLNPDDEEIVEFLVREHLRMSAIATRYDVRDRKMLMDFARTVGTVERLELLYLLSFADMSAVNDGVWNEFRRSLLDELYVAAVEVLEEGLAGLAEESERAARVRERVRAALGVQGGRSFEGFLADLPDRYFATVFEGDLGYHFEVARRLEEEDPAVGIRHFPDRAFTEIIVVTRDRPGLFAQLTGALTANNLDIVLAWINTTHSGNVLDVFRVSHAPGTGLAQDARRWERVVRDIAAAVHGELDVEAQVRAAARPSILDRPPRRPVPTVAMLRNDVSDDYSVIEVSTRDRRGVLYAIARTLHAQGLDVHLAKIRSEPDRVWDSFYVTEIGGGKVEDERRSAAICRALEDALGESEVREGGLP